ncbi:hypothetical protein EDB86DRAFT_2829850 [Lactarius hatsudake]|nr:hypothetical protein EDB86DRAFT_2829850 [Lactarius hatsudake]
MYRVAVTTSRIVEFFIFCHDQDPTIPTAFFLARKIYEKRHLLERALAEKKYTVTQSQRSCSTMEINYVAALNDLLRRHPSGNLAPSLTWAMEQHPDGQSSHVAILMFRGDTVSKGEDASRMRAIQAAAQRALAYFRENGVPDPKDYPMDANTTDLPDNGLPRPLVHRPRVLGPLCHVVRLNKRRGRS